MKKKIRKVLRSAAKVSRKKAARSVRGLRRSAVRRTRFGMTWTAQHYAEFRAYVESPAFEAHLDAYAARIGVKFPKGSSVRAKVAMLGAAGGLQIRAAARLAGRIFARGGALGGGAQALWLAISLYREFAGKRAKRATSSA